MDRFWNKVAVSDLGSCWEWQGSRNKAGYGRFGYEGSCRLAHRVAAICAGIIDGVGDTRLVCHHCDNPPCVNPLHLFAGDHKANRVDAVNKGRARGAVGERNTKAKLNADIVIAMREEYAQGNTSYPRLAQKYGVTHPACRFAVTGQTWSHIRELLPEEGPC